MENLSKSQMDYALNQVIQAMYEIQEAEHIRQVHMGMVSESRVNPPTDFERAKETQLLEQLKDVEKNQKELMTNAKILRYLCPALKSATGDAFDIAKIIIGVLVPLTIAGTITITISPWLIGFIALTISRMGIRAICEGYLNEIDQKNN